MERDTNTFGECLEGWECRLIHFDFRAYQPLSNHFLLRPLILLSGALFYSAAFIPLPYRFCTLSLYHFSLRSLPPIFRRRSLTTQNATRLLTAIRP